MDSLLLDLPSEFVGERIVVRPFLPGDGAALFEAVEESRAHLLPWLPWGPKHATPEDSEAFVRKTRARFDLREDLGLGIFERTTGRFLGGIGLHRIDWNIPSFEIGYWVRASAQGHGYVTEATRLLIEFCFEILGANRVSIHVAAGNDRSAAIPKRLGLVLEGTLRNGLKRADGALCDRLVFGMTADERRAAPSA